MNKSTPPRPSLIKLLIPSIILVIAIVLGISFLQSRSNDTENQNNDNTNVATDGTPLIKHIGIDIDALPITNKQMGEYNRPYFDYGFQIATSSAAPARKNPQPTFILPLGTKVHALIDGVVANVTKIYSNDYSIHLQASEGSDLIFELEHVINPTVKAGDRVKAGQVIAEVSDYDAHNYSGYGLVEIGILKGGNPPSHICPFQYLDPSIKDETWSKLKIFYKKWNDLKESPVYDENLATPGCITLEEVEG